MMQTPVKVSSGTSDLLAGESYPPLPDPALRYNLSQRERISAAIGGARILIL
jgi:hypothetical protein